MDEKIIRLPEVMQRVGLSRATIYNKVKDGSFPAQIKLGRLSGWVESEVQTWISNQIKASRPAQAANHHPHAQAA